MVIHNQEQEVDPRTQNPEESQSLIGISCPKTTTASQMKSAVFSVTEPMKRERATKAEM